MLFDYKAVNSAGRNIRGRLDANNLADLEARLQRLGLDLISGKPPGHRAVVRKARVRRRELINFFFYLEQLSRAGVPTLDGLVDLRDSLEHSRFREIVAGLVEGIEGGQTLSQALSAYPWIFSPVHANLICAGETAGKVPEVLASLTESLKWEDELASHTRKVVIYPAFVGTAVLAITFFLMTYLVPQLKQFVQGMGQALPFQTRALFFVSDVVVRNGHVLLLAPVLAALGLRIILRNNPAARTRIDALKLQVPVVGAILKKIILSRFAGTFALLYAAGIPILEAVRTTQGGVGNRAVQRALQDIERSIEEGRNVTRAFHDAALFPPLVVRMIRVGENTGNLDRALLNVSYFYNRDVRESIEKVQAMIEPGLTVLMGGLLGWIMLSIIGPIYDLVSKVKL